MEDKKIEELRYIENQLQHVLAQKQMLQLEMNEINNALGELSHSDDEVYRIFSGIMIKSNKKNAVKELKERKNSMKMKIDSLEKQEDLLNKNSEELRDEINQ